ncbi:MAG: UvrD-helicase domain-containing protein [Litorilinea sp.]
MSTQTPVPQPETNAGCPTGHAPGRRHERIADLHIHSHYSRATSKNLDFEHLTQWAQLKGVQIVGTGDISHPGWLQEIRDKLEPAEPGLFRLKPELAAAVQAQVPAACRAEVRFLLAGEISNIYKRPDPQARTAEPGRSDVRKVHNLIFAPTLQAVESIQIALEKIGNIRADGRPILGLDSRDLLELVLAADDACALIPAHIWTPWFSMLGSKSGFDSVEACFGDLTSHIFALETGLSSDPPMNWRVSNLDGYTLVSNSDAHSPPKLAREATIFYGELSYAAIFDALRSGDPAHFGGTLEFFPEEGKYHHDGHRKCGIAWTPLETLAQRGICPVCGKPVTVGVSHRVERLADRPPGGKPARVHPFVSLIPLPEILSEVHGVGPQSRRVQQDYHRLLALLGSELAILRHVPTAEIAQVGGEPLAEGIARMRAGNVLVQGGYDGEYGTIKVLAPELGLANSAIPQLGLFGEEAAPVSDPVPDPASESETAVAVNGTPPPAPTLADPPTFADPDGWQPLPLFDDGTLPSLPPAPVGVRMGGPVGNGEDAPEGERAPWAQLNAEQAAAVQCTDRPLLIVAGPGTGKTHTLTTRIAWLVQGRQAAPESILAITFTNKAAEELATRLRTRLGDTVGRRLTVQTFHALGARLLRDYGDALAPLGIELSPTFGIADGETQDALLAAATPDLGVRDRARLRDRISDAKNRLDLPDVDAIPSASGPDEGDFADFAQTLAAYDAQLRANSLVDYDDLIALSVRLLEEVPAVRAAVQARFRWISVDEYQDVNAAQVRFLRQLVGPATNICAIGDPDQAIYGFRGADYRHFFAFAEDFPNATIFTLQRNYRSPQSLLTAARQVIAKNPDRMAVELWSDFAEMVQLDVCAAATDRAEAESIVHRIEQMVGGISHFSLDSGRVDGGAGGNPDANRLLDAPNVAASPEDAPRTFGDFAVLFRLHAQAAPLVEALDRSGIPYQVVGGPAPYAHADMRWLIAALQWAQTPTTHVALLRLLAWDAAPHELAQLQRDLSTWLDAHLPADCDPAACDATACDAGQVLQQLVTDLAAGDSAVAQDGRAAAELSTRAQLLARFWPTLLAPADGEALSAAPVQSALTRLGAFLSEHAGHFPPLHATRFADLHARAQSFGAQWAAFLEALALTRPADGYDPRADRVTLMTLHAAKGLEFPVVFLAGCEEGLLPYVPPVSAARAATAPVAPEGTTEDARAEDGTIEADMAVSDAAIEEERRLFYVGMTRAQARLILTHARRRRLFGRTTEPHLSRFVDDIEAALKAVQQMAPRPMIQSRAEGQQLSLF